MGFTCDHVPRMVCWSGNENGIFDRTIDRTLSVLKI